MHRWMDGTAHRLTDLTDHLFPPSFHHHHHHHHRELPLRFPPPHDRQEPPPPTRPPGTPPTICSCLPPKTPHTGVGGGGWPPSSHTPPHPHLTDTHPTATSRSKKPLPPVSPPTKPPTTQDILYGSSQAGGERLSFRRLSALLAYAMDIQTQQQTPGASDNAVQALFVDFDRLPSTGLRLNETLAFLLSDNASPLRALLVSEVTNASDLVLRQQMRRAAQRLPRPPLLPYPAALVDSLAPPLSIEEDVFLGSLTELGYTLLGLDATTSTSPSPLPRPDQVLAWLTQQSSSTVEDALDVAKLLQPGSATGQQMGSFAAEIARGLADKARPRINQAVALGPAGLLGGRGAEINKK